MALSRFELGAILELSRQTARRFLDLVNLFHPHSGKCVDIREAGTANGTPIDLYDCNGTAAQEFEALGNSDGSVTFQNPTSGSCLDVADAKTANGTKLDLWGCNGTDAQKWTATPN